MPNYLVMMEKKSTGFFRETLETLHERFNVLFLDFLTAYTSSKSAQKKALYNCDSLSHINLILNTAPAALEDFFRMLLVLAVSWLSLVIQIKYRS